MELTVVICTLNRCASLQNTLRSLAAQESVPGAAPSWEVLVIDNGSEDRTIEAVRSMASRFPVELRLSQEPERGLARARNRGLREARGNAVLFLDDDVVAATRLVAEHASCLADPTVLGAGGRIRPVLPADAPEWWAALLPYEIGGPTARYDFGDRPLDVGAGTGRPAPFGANMAVRRRAALRIEGFRTDLGWGDRLIPGEESDLYARLQSVGGRVRYLPEAAVAHMIDAGKLTADYFRRWYRGHGRATVLMSPPGGALERAGRILGESRKSVAWQLRALWRRRDRSGAEHRLALRKAAKAQGKLLQLVGL